jgi:hypothetical protein
MKVDNIFFSFQMNRTNVQGIAKMRSVTKVNIRDVLPTIASTHIRDKTTLRVT